MVMFWLPLFGLQRLLLHLTVLVADLPGGLWQQQVVLVAFNVFNLGVMKIVFHPAGLQREVWCTDGSGASRTAAPPLVWFKWAGALSTFSTVPYSDVLTALVGLRRLLLHSAVLVTDRGSSKWSQGGPQETVVFVFSGCLVWSLGHASSSVW